METDDQPAAGVGGRIAMLRERRGLDQIEFAAAAGKKPRTIQSWEGDKVTPPRREVARLGRIFGVDAGWIWTGEGTPPSWAGADPQQDLRELLGFFRQAVESNDDDGFAALLKRLQANDPHLPEGPDEDRCPELD